MVADPGGTKGIWDAVDTSPDLVGQNVLIAFDVAIRRKSRPT